MARTPIIFGNWKLNKSSIETAEFMSNLAKVLPKLENKVEVGLAPVMTCLTHAISAKNDAPIQVAAQDMHWLEHGAFTGTVSAQHIKELGCTHVLIGHSERRQLFGETDGRVSDKVRLAFDTGLTPIACVGENLTQRESGQAEDIVLRQVDAFVQRLTADEVKELVIAYEPIWAIGTGQTATPEDANQMHRAIRESIRVKFEDAADDVRIQYGGSVKPANAKALLAQAHIDGALVGGASLKVEDFMGILSAC